MFSLFPSPYRRYTPLKASIVPAFSSGESLTPFSSQITRFTSAQSIETRLKPVRALAPFSSTLKVVPNQYSAVDPKIIANPAIPMSGLLKANHPSAIANTAATITPARFCGALSERRTRHRNDSPGSGPQLASVSLLSPEGIYGGWGWGLTVLGRFLGERVDRCFGIEVFRSCGSASPLLLQRGGGVEWSIVCCTARGAPTFGWGPLLVFPSLTPAHSLLRSCLAREREGFRLSPAVEDFADGDVAVDSADGVGEEGGAGEHG